MTPEHIAVGSTWYAWGEHVEVAELTRLDGRLAVVLRKQGSKKKQLPIPVKALLNHGVRTNTEEG